MNITTTGVQQPKSMLIAGGVRALVHSLDETAGVINEVNAETGSYEDMLIDEHARVNITLQLVDHAEDSITVPISLNGKVGCVKQAHVRHVEYWRIGFPIAALWAGESFANELTDKEKALNGKKEVVFNMLNQNLTTIGVNQDHE